MNVGNLNSTLLWGGTEFWEDESGTDIDSYLDSHVSGSYSAFSFHHKNYFENPGVADLGNRQWEFGWLNVTKDYGWVVLFSFGGVIYGKRVGTTKFSFARLDL